MPSLRGVVVHDGFCNLVWASDEWDLDREPRHHQGHHREGADGLGGIRRHRAYARCRPCRVLLRHTRRAHRAARRRQPDRAFVGHANRGAAAADRAPAGAAGAGVPAARILVADEIGFPRTRSQCARTRPGSDAGNFVASVGGLQRRRRIRADHEDRARAHGLRARGSVGARQEHRVVPDAQRPAHVAGIAAAGAASPDGLDAAAAAYHRRQSHFQGRERRRGALQDSRLPGPAPVGTGHGRARPVQSAERAGLRFAPDAHRRSAGETGHQHHSGAIRFEHGAHDPAGVRTPGRGAARIDEFHGNAHHSLSRHRSAARHQ